MTDTFAYWSHFVVASMFGVGLLGFLLRRNAIVMLMCLELMLNAVNLLLVELSVLSNSPSGVLLVVFVITIAAAEVAVGLGIILNLYRLKDTVDIDLFRSLQG